MALAFPIRQSVKNRITFATLTIFLLSFWMMSYYATHVLRKDMERMLGEHQFSSASVVAAHIDQEIGERLNGLEHMATRSVQAMQAGPKAMQALVGQSLLLESLFNGGVIVLSPDGTAIAEVPVSSGRIGANYMEIDTVAAALQEGKSTIGRPIIGKKLLAPVFGMTVPILDANGKVIGALSGVTNLGKPNFLDKISDSQYGKTGGYMLVTPGYRMVVTATDKRRVMEVLPAPGINLLVDRFIQGFEGSGVTVNPVGVEVLASAKRIPLADWYVAVAIPTKEAFAPVQDMRNRMHLATAFLTLVVGTLVWWVVKRQLAPMHSAVRALASMSEKNQPLKPLPIAQSDEIGTLIGGFNNLLDTLSQREVLLKISENKLTAILDNVDAHIYLKDTHGRYLFANQALCRYFGTSMQQIIGQSDESFFDAETTKRLSRNDQMVLREGKVVKTDEADLHLISGGTSTHLSVKLPLRNEFGEIYALCGISTDITERKHAEEELRIAAIAFECQEGIVVLDTSRKILRVNQAFTQITGYSQEDVQGKTTNLLRSEKQPTAFYEAVWSQVMREGVWQGEMWRRRKSGEEYPEWATVAAVKDKSGQITHFVANLTDATNSQLQEEQRLHNETMQRNMLVREVHHRIKNNLQGIIGILRQFAQAHPETADPINQAIGQVKAISVIHGLQGRVVTSMVRVCELTSAIAEEIQTLWQTPVVVNIPREWIPCVITEKEAVPIALVLNEMILNAVKHGGKDTGGVSIFLRKGASPDTIVVSVINKGQLQLGRRQSGSHQSGIPLIEALIPRNGARIAWEQLGDHVVTLLELGLPAISLETEEST